jgi:large subunit ribosomal protein L34
MLSEIEAAKKFGLGIGFLSAPQVGCGGVLRPHKSSRACCKRVAALQAISPHHPARTHTPLVDIRDALSTFHEVFGAGEPRGGNATHAQEFHEVSLQSINIISPYIDHMIRSMSTRTLVRPSPFPQSALRQPLQTPASISETASEPTLDLLPKISGHPSLAGIQVRNGPRDTYSPSHFVRKRRLGFLARKRSRTGRMILKRRQAKRRSTLSH